MRERLWKRNAKGSDAKDRGSDQGVLWWSLCGISLNEGCPSGKAYRPGLRSSLGWRHDLHIDLNRGMIVRSGLKAERGESVAELTDRLVLRISAATTHRRLRNAKQWQHTGVGVKTQCKKEHHNAASENGSVAIGPYSHALSLSPRIPPVNGAY